MPILQAIINIVASIILVSKLGLIGVVLGTLISYILIPCWNRPYIIYKYVFKVSPKKYYKEYIINIIILFIMGYLINSIINVIGLNTTIVCFIINVLIVIVLYFIIFSLVYFKTDNYQYYLNLVKEKVGSIKNGR